LLIFIAPHHFDVVLFLFAGGTHEKIFTTFFGLPAIFGLSRCLLFEEQKTSMHFDNRIYIHQVRSCAGARAPAE
jgi:hypothetical protein